ncbi:DNA replication complex GINS protein SLD5 [Venturia canescens]|uniref:DNA replication complex GINS protein SLD5 n=1 Tax=Venturia canescens TaxID=32260 RepID=UPI001C9CD9D4|nr:DNA replication complex GINS protein SLD5 [Venturia canescens]
MENEDQEIQLESSSHDVMDLSEEEELTAEQAMTAMDNAWLNEKFAPEILPHETELVDCMLRQIAYMLENVKRLKEDDLRLGLHTLEVERIRFVISSYLRLRIEKIERYVIHVLSEERKRSAEERYLSPEEFKFAQDYLASVEKLFKTLALQHMPPNFQEFQIDQFTVKPNLHSHVLLRANKRVEAIIIPGSNDQEVSLEAGSQYIMQYKAVADLVKSGVVQLI